MTAVAEGRTDSHMDSDAIWRALSNPTRRQLLDAMSRGPRTTGDLAEAMPDLSRFAVMQHLGVLTDAGLGVGRRRGGHRYNHLNPGPLGRWCERWVVPLADRAGAELLALERHVERAKREGGPAVTVMTDEIRTVRIEAEVRVRSRGQAARTRRIGETPPATSMGTSPSTIRRFATAPADASSRAPSWTP